MRVPSRDEFLQHFGLEPKCYEFDDTVVGYSFQDHLGRYSLEISFSEVAASFQVIVRVDGCEVAVFSTELVTGIAIVEEIAGPVLVVDTEISGVITRTRISLGETPGFRASILEG